MATSETGRTGESEKSARSLIGFVTVTGDEENGLRVSLPKDTALDEGIEPGDTLRFEHDPVAGEFVLPYRE
jgi:hypothetical protein